MNICSEMSRALLSFTPAAVCRTNETVVQKAATHADRVVNTGCDHRCLQKKYAAMLSPRTTTTTRISVGFNLRE